MASVLRQASGVYINRLTANYRQFYRYGRQLGWSRSRSAFWASVDAFRCPF